MSSPLRASSVKERVEPNDTSSNLDIHKVITNLSPITMYLRLESWDQFRLKDMHETWALALDTFGTHRFDRSVEIFPSRHGLKCAVTRGGQPIGSIGTRHATRPDAKSAACHLPRDWFCHIHRAIRFVAFIGNPTSIDDTDIAPGGDHVFRWIWVRAGRNEPAGQQHEGVSSMCADCLSVPGCTLLRGC
jgi:hypothetical protein